MTLYHKKGPKTKRTVLSWNPHLSLRGMWVPLICLLILGGLFYLLLVVPRPMNQTPFQLQMYKGLGIIQVTSVLQKGKETTLEMLFPLQQNQTETIILVMD